MAISEKLVYIIDLSAFKYLNSSLCLLRTTSSPLYAICSSWIKKLLTYVTVSSLVKQSNTFRLIEGHGKVTSYLQPPAGYSMQVNLFAFHDASHFESYSQLCYKIGVDLG